MVLASLTVGATPCTGWLDSLSVVRDGDVYDKREIGNHAIHLLVDQHQHSQH